MRMMKFAVLFHLLMNCFMYTNKRVLTPETYDRDIHYRPPGGKPLGDRFDNFPSMTVLLVAILTIFIYMIYKSVVMTIVNMIRLKKERKRA